MMGERWASLPEQSPSIASAVPTTALAPLEVSNQFPTTSITSDLSSFETVLLDVIIQKDGLV